MLIVVYVLEWCGMYIVHYFGMLCRLFAGAIFMLVTIGFVTGLGNGEQLINMLVVGFAFFLITRVGVAIVNGIALVHVALRKLVKI